MHCILHRNYWKQTVNLGLDLLTEINVEIFENMVSFIVEGSGDGRHVHKSLGDVSSIFVDTLDNSGESQWFVGDDNEDII